MCRFKINVTSRNGNKTYIRIGRIKAESIAKGIENLNVIFNNFNWELVDLKLI